MPQKTRSTIRFKQIIPALVAMCSIGSWSAIGHAQVVAGNSYRIINACGTGTKVMAIAGNSTANEAAVVLATRNDTQASQIFKFESSNGAFVIRAQVSGKYFDIYKESTALKAPLQQFTFNGGANQRFTIQASSNGYYLIRNVNSQLYLNLVDANPVDGNKFEQYSNTGSCAQKFKFSLVGTATTSPTPTPAPPASTPAPTPTPTPTPAPVRDPLKQPFASSSIWNMPIGSGAVYVPANLSDVPGGDVWAPMPQLDEEIIVLKPTAPLTNINYSDAAWTGKSRCSATGGLLVQVPMPSDFTVPTNGENSSAVFLMPDKRTLIHTQPFARCYSGGSATSLVKFNAVDLYGDGREGSHGGSRMSAIGGSIRMGELRPGGPAPRHALKVNVYAKEALYRCTTRTDCWKWPAFTSDGYAVGWYGATNGNSNTAMKMGTLLAIPASVNIANLNLETEPGRQLAWTLQNYGAYIVDDTWGPSFSLNVEHGPNGSKPAEFKADYGFDMSARVRDNTPWVRDMQKLVKALYAVSNNTATSVGGGGTPRQALAPSIAP